MTEEQLQLIEDKYGKLIHKISHWISGDNAIASHQDNVQDLWLAVMDAIRGFERKEDQSFEDFWGSVGFDKYIKTCLWNIKNSKGAKITKKYPLTKRVVNIVDNEEVLMLEDPHSFSSESEIFLEDLPTLLTEEQCSVVTKIVQNPAYIKPSGKANVKALSKELGKPWNETNKILQEIGERIKNEL